MVSFWPWRGEDSSPASFEKTLSALSTKITDNQSRLERVRSTSRRVRVLWTLYLSFAYLIYTIVLLLVVGYQNLRPWEWVGVGGGPLVIFITRTALSFYFNFRIDSLSAQLKQQQDERAKTIQKLKDATKYDSTLQLLEKYGDDEGKPKKQKKGNAPGSDGQQGGPGKQVGQPQGQPGQQGRTTMAPPPTANIQRPTSAHGTPQPGHGDPLRASPHPPPNLEPSAEFAPNAFAQPPPAPVSQQYAQGALPADSSHWYDRILDLLLGEDETAPKNRIVLVCSNCRLVNGQAPPGTKSLAEVGFWKCMSCGAFNGEVDEGKRIVKEVLGDAEGSSNDGVVSVGEEFKDDDEEGEDTEGSAVEVGHEDVSPEGQSTGKHSSSGTGKRRSKKG